MRNSVIEQWALRIIAAVESHQPTEDSQVELKSIWPTDYAKAARQIAGQANAARGENILWLIGVDEVNGVVGANYEERTDWIAGISANFDGLFPRYYDLNVPTNSGQTVVAFVFETDRAPFVVRNPHYGKRKDDPISLEVPWRDGTRVRSASRSDLMLILSDVRPLRSLLSELEWNEAITAKDGHDQEQFRTSEFDRAMREDSLSLLDSDLKSVIRDAYIAISNAQSYKKTLEMTSDGGSRIKRLRQSHQVTEAAKPKIDRALKELRQYLGEN